MENKYFTPNIEDLCIGYELEMNWNRAYEKKWVPIKISIQDEEFAYTDEISDIINALDDGMSEARVPYLTKEQIEAEGWEEHSSDFFKKDLLMLQIDLEEYNILIRKGSWYPEETLFKGNCKDINTFRKIIKLLENGFTK